MSSVHLLNARDENKQKNVTYSQEKSSLYKSILRWLKLVVRDLKAASIMGSKFPAG